MRGNIDGGVRRDIAFRDIGELREIRILIRPGVDAGHDFQFRIVLHHCPQFTAHPAAASVYNDSDHIFHL